MNMVTCKDGHYYDQDKNAVCPYCANLSSFGVRTQVTEIVGNDSGKTAIYSPSSDNDGKTSLYASSSVGSKEDPRAKEDASRSILLSGWLAIISEQGRGTSYTLTFGMNTIGRSESNHISIQNADTSITREKHAMIIYDYENNIFYIKHGDGQYLTYLNGEVLLDTKILKANDKIKVGSTELIFIPLCSDSFKWDK